MRLFGVILGWILQFALGCGVGLFAGWCLISRRRRGIWMTPDAIPWFLLGTALIGGACASFWGDRLWIGDRYRMIPPDAPERTAASVTASLVAGLAGLALAAYALILHAGS